MALVDEVLQGKITSGLINQRLKNLRPIPPPPAMLLPTLQRPIPP